MAVGALVVVLASASKAKAHFDAATGLAVGAAALLAPGDVGVAVPTAETSPSRFVIGWSWQVPVAGFAEGHVVRHRIVPGVDLLPHSDGVSWRGRLGYRYGRRHMFAGAGVGVDGAGLNLSPELGVKFLHGDTNNHEIDVSMHLLARAEIAPESGNLRGATVLLGWNVF